MQIWTTIIIIKTNNECLLLDNTVKEIIKSDDKNNEKYQIRSYFSQFLVHVDPADHVLLYLTNIIYN